ncbi:hypothetical protein SDC9_192269 [bioreactor metagenome]|uniref:Uncharacterized protein n=1 Tax=bioreactor metagenome TaxID=1076179 RepID=A0A645I8T2_9ZZZZ
MPAMLAQRRFRSLGARDLPARSSIADKASRLVKNRTAGHRIPVQEPVVSTDGILEIGKWPTCRQHRLVRRPIRLV